MACWTSVCSGSPSGVPSGNRTYPARGTPHPVVMTGIVVRLAVAKPASSMAFCSSPTDRRQTGHPPVSRATSTPSERKRSTIVGTAWARKALG